MSFPSSAMKESSAPVVRVSVDAEGVLPMTEVDHQKRKSADSHARKLCVRSRSLAAVRRLGKLANAPQLISNKCLASGDDKNKGTRQGTGAVALLTFLFLFMFSHDPLTTLHENPSSSSYRLPLRCWRCCSIQLPCTPQHRSKQ
jgi:hypothetical protein